MSLKSLKNLNKKKIKSPQYTFRPCLSYIKIYVKNTTNTNYMLILKNEFLTVT